MQLAALLATAAAASMPPALLAYHASWHKPLSYREAAAQPVRVARQHVSLLGTTPLVEPLIALYKVEGTQCGEAHVRSEIVPFAVQFAGLTIGDCASIGFAKPATSHTLTVPVVGSIRIALFTCE